MIRVAIADDHKELRVALRLLLKRYKNIEVVCEAGTGQEAIECVNNLQPDVLLMDIQMPVMDGFEATRQITSLSVPTAIILISTYRGSIIASEAAAAGAKGFVSKDDAIEWLHIAIEKVHQGETFFRK